MIKFGNKVQETKNSNQFNMFGENSESVYKPLLPQLKNGQLWIYYQKKKKLLVYIFLTHDDYKFEIDNFSSLDLSVLSDLQKIENKNSSFGVIIDVEHKETQKGKKV